VFWNVVLTTYLFFLLLLLLLLLFLLLLILLLVLLPLLPTTQHFCVNWKQLFLLNLTWRPI